MAPATPIASHGRPKSHDAFGPIACKLRAFDACRAHKACRGRAGVSWRGSARWTSFVHVGGTFAAAALCLAGCRDQDSNSLGDFRADWSELPDGSKYALKRDETGENSAAWRCWPIGAGEFDCLVAGTGALGSWTVGRAKKSDGLGRVMLPVATPGSGYSCGYVMGKREQIDAADGELISNVVKPWWTPKFVTNYMAANGVQGTSWFPCLNILQVLQAGSLATLRTTSVTRGMMNAIR